MHPYVFGNIPAYPIALAVAVLVSALFGTTSLRRLGISVTACVRWEIILATAGLLGAKLNALIERGGALLPLSREWAQGYRYPGAAIGVLIVLAFRRRHAADIPSFAVLPMPWRHPLVSVPR